jgi:hypothetical protein
MEGFSSRAMTSSDMQFIMIIPVGTRQLASLEAAASQGGEREAQGERALK